MLPLAPGLFSTTTGWPHFSLSFGPMTRARMSMPVPGENGTTSVTVRLGNACPCAMDESSASTVAQTNLMDSNYSSDMARIIGGIATSPVPPIRIAFDKGNPHHPHFPPPSPPPHPLPQLP